MFFIIVSNHKLTQSNCTGNVSFTLGDEEVYQRKKKGSVTEDHNVLRAAKLVQKLVQKHFGAKFEPK